MRRPKAAAPPADDKDLQNWVQRVLRSSASEAVELLLHISVKRLINLRSSGVKLDLRTPSCKLAAIWQLTGTEQSKACCINCAGGNGPFNECVTAPPNQQDHYHMFGKCANCFYSGKSKCSLTTKVPRSSKVDRLDLLKGMVKQLRGQKNDEKPKDEDFRSGSSSPLKKSGKSPPTHLTHQNLQFRQMLGEPVQETPLASADPSSYHIMGSLSLPQPSESDLTPSHVELAESMRLYFQHLKSRDMSLITKTINNLEHEFEQFSEEEPGKWQNAIGGAPDKDKSLLVRPCGRLQAPIRLNEAITLKDTPSLELTLLGSLTYYIAARNNWFENIHQ